MSLFGNDAYCWRETYFLLLQQPHRPRGDDVAEALAGLGDRYQVQELRSNEEGLLESVTLLSPYDYAAMDVSFVEGEEVLEQIEEISRELAQTPLNEEEKEKFARLPSFDARYDVFHFEQVNSSADDEEFLDPGGLLIVLETLAELCQGVAVDPQSGTIV